MKIHSIPGNQPATGGTILRALLPVGASGLLIIAGLAWVVHSGSRSRPVIPKAPDNAVQVVIQGLAENKPQVLWDALPASYQADVREVIATFCANADPDIYNQMFRILDKVVRVMKEKESYFAKSPVALSIPLLESSVGRNWSHDVGLLDAVAHSELSSLATLKEMDPGAFLASTGQKVMAGLEDLRVRTQRSPGLNQWQKLSQSLNESGVQFVKTTEDHGYLKFSSPTNSAGKEVQLVQVEGRWIPADLAASWKSKVAQAKERIAKLSGPEFAKARPLLTMMLGAVETNLDALLKVGSQKDFDERLKSFAAIGGMLQSMKELQARGTR